MYYPNYNPFYMNRNYYNRQYQNIKKDTVPNFDTIPFSNYYNKTESKKDSKDIISSLFSNFETDDLIIIGIILLLSKDINENLTLIIILGMILFNFNIKDILNFFG